MATVAPTLKRAFAAPVEESQTVFRAILRAMSYPGTLQSIEVDLQPFPGLSMASVAVILALADRDTPIWLSPDIAPTGVSEYLRFHCGSPITTEPNEAAFAMARADSHLPSLTLFNPGTDQYPDRSTTVILEATTLAEGSGVTLSGPGIKSPRTFDAGSVPTRLWADRAALQSHFPRGIDMIFTCGDRLAALPRTTRTQER